MALPSPLAWAHVEVVDGRSDGVLGLGVLKLSESSSMASICPWGSLLAFSSCPVAVHIYRDTHLTDTFWLVLYVKCHQDEKRSPGTSMMEKKPDTKEETKDWTWWHQILRSKNSSSVFQEAQSLQVRNSFQVLKVLSPEKMP